MELLDAHTRTREPGSLGQDKEPGRPCGCGGTAAFAMTELCNSQAYATFALVALQVRLGYASTSGRPISEVTAESCLTPVGFSAISDRLSQVGRWVEQGCRIQGQEIATVGTDGD